MCFLVFHGRKKTDHRTHVVDLYISQRFWRSRKLSKEIVCPWSIVSAKDGSVAFKRTVDQIIPHKCEKKTEVNRRSLQVGQEILRDLSGPYGFNNGAMNKRRNLDYIHNDPTEAKNQQCPRKSDSSPGHEKALSIFQVQEQNFASHDGESRISTRTNIYLASNLKVLCNLKREDQPGRAEVNCGWDKFSPNMTSEQEWMCKLSMIRAVEGYRESKQRSLNVFVFRANQSGFKQESPKPYRAKLITEVYKSPEKIHQKRIKILIRNHQPLTRSRETA